MQTPDEWWIETSTGGQKLLVFLVLPVTALILLVLISYVITTT